MAMTSDFEKIYDEKTTEELNQIYLTICDPQYLPEIYQTVENILRKRGLTPPTPPPPIYKYKIENASIGTGVGYSQGKIVIIDDYIVFVKEGNLLNWTGGGGLVGAAVAYAASAVMDGVDKLRNKIQKPDESSEKLKIITTRGNQHKKVNDIKEIELRAGKITAGLTMLIKDKSNDSTKNLLISIDIGSDIKQLLKRDGFKGFQIKEEYERRIAEAFKENTGLNIIIKNSLFG